VTLTGVAFMVGFFVSLALALVRFPLVGLLTYVAVFYLHPPSRWWGMYLPDLRWSMLAAAVTLIASLHYRPQVSRPSWLSTTPARILLAYTVWLWIQNLWALDPVQHLECCFLFSKYLLVYYAIYKLVDTPERVRWFYLMHAAGCLFLGAIAWTTPVSGRLDGVGGPGIDDSNTLGMQMSTGVLAAAMMMLIEKRWAWLLCMAAAALAVNAMVLAGSRGAFLALIAGGLVLAWLRPRIHARKFAIYALIAAIGFGAVASAQFWERMDTLKTAAEDSGQMDTSAESRIEIAKAQWRMAKEYPFGNGHRGTEFLSSRYLDSKYLTETGARSSHNTFLTTLVEQGIPGAALYCAAIVWGLGCARKLKQRASAQDYRTMTLYGTIALSGLVVVLIAGQFADFLKVEVQIWLGAILAVAMQEGPARESLPGIPRA
jgi:O-antigen ligase